MGNTILYTCMCIQYTGTRTYICLSHAVRSFIELTKMLFTVLGVKVFLSEKPSQDAGEIFGCQRQRGGTVDDPTVAEFIKNTTQFVDMCCGATVEAHF